MSVARRPEAGASGSAARAMAATRARPARRNGVQAPLRVGSFSATAGPISFREVDASRAGLATLARFYRDRYVAEFPDPDERESLANMRRYLRLKAQGWYGPNNYHILIAELGGAPVGGAVFDYLAEPNAGVIEFLFVAADRRIRGVGRALLDETLRLLRQDARERRGKRLAAVVAEMNDPFRRPETPDNLDPFVRAAIWGRWGFGVLDFPYVQPALSARQARVEGLVLIARTLGAPRSAVSSAWVARTVGEYLRWAMRIEQPGDNADYREMSAFLGARRTVVLEPLLAYIGHDPEREFEVEAVRAARGDGRDVGRASEPAGRNDPEEGGTAQRNGLLENVLSVIRAAIPQAGRVAAIAEFAAALERAQSGGAPYHLWALRAPGRPSIDGAASFFTLPSAGFGGYIVLAGRLRGRGLLPLLIARIEERMIRDDTKAEGWFVECGDESVDAFLRADFAEVPVEYRPPVVGSASRVGRGEPASPSSRPETVGGGRPAGRKTRPAAAPPERLHLLYKPFGIPRPPLTLPARFVLRALREMLRHVYAVAAPTGHPTYRSARDTLRTDRDGRVVLVSASKQPLHR